MELLSPTYLKILENVASAVAPQGKKRGNKVSVAFADTNFVGSIGVDLPKEEERAHTENLTKQSPLVKSVLNILNGGKNDSVERLAFETNPYVNNTYQGLYRRKLRLLPDELLKRLSIQDDLVACITMIRANQMAAFGRPQPDRFSTGYKIELDPGESEHMSPEKKKEWQERIARAEKLLLSCGQTRGWSDQDSLGFSSFLYVTARNAVVFGRCATEVVYIQTLDGERKFHSIRPMDAGTIYRAAPLRDAAQKVREEALGILRHLKPDKKLIPDKYLNDEYPWVQVIEGRPIQAFTEKECLVHNFFPCTDIELDGYPVTPLDTIIAAVTTHINITTSNKLFFQNGRLARGMIVIKSDDIDETTTGAIRQQFMASINGTGNAHRMPIFGVGSEDDISWMPIDNSSRDMEFQYLSDSNARTILSAFQMSPEEVPGLSHLSRGTNSQSLSESNNEYQLEAHRDVGIRPLMSQIQNYINQRILPLIDEELSNIASFKFLGLDSESPEKESVRLQTDLALHMQMNEVLEKVEKKALPRKFGGEFLLNPQWGAAIDKFCYRGDIMEYFFDMKDASKDPSLRFIADPLWFQWQQMLMEQQQMQMQQQQAQQQAQQGQLQQGGQLTQATDQAQQAMQKSEKLTASQKRLLTHQEKVVESALKEFEKDSETVLREILGAVGKLPKKD